LLWIGSLLLTLVAVILCVTVILLPVGIPLLGYARRMFTLSLRLMLPRAVATNADPKNIRTRSHQKATRVRTKRPLVS
jgi:hypothetical protein